MRFLIFFFLILFSFKLPAQELFFSQPSNFQNLPSQETYSVFQDSRGFIWITTDAGICRYDGNRLTVFTAKDGLPENVVFGIYEDDYGRVWFSTLSGYLFYYQEGAFHSIAANEALKKICRSTSIHAFFIGDHDTLYLASGGGSAGGARAVIKIPSENNFRDVILDSLRFLSCTRFYLTNPKHPNQLIVGSGGLIPRFEPTEITIAYGNEKFRLPVRKEDRASANGGRGIVDKYGNIYVVLGKHLLLLSKKGIIKWQYIFHQNINSFYLDPDNDLWVCTEMGGYLFKNSSGNKAPIPFLSNLGLSSAFLDREGTVWVATLEKGVLQSMSKAVLFFDFEKDHPMYFQKNTDHLNITFSSQRIASLYKNDSVFLNDYFKTILPPGKILIASFIDSNFYYLEIQGRFSIWDRKEMGFIIHDKAYANIKEILKIGKDSMLFVSPVSVQTFYNKKIHRQINPFPIRNALQLKNKKILLSSRNNSGVYEFANDKFMPFLPNLPQLKTRINCMVEDAKGNIWFATNEYGLYCYDYLKQIHHYTTTDGLISDKINTLTIDDQGNLWLGSFNGLTKLTYTNDVHHPRIINFGKSHGIPNLQIEKIIAFHGTIACIAKNVCFFFKANQLKKNTISPLNYILSVSINDKPYPVNDTAVLTYDKNNLHILTSLLSNKSPDQKRFLYKLVGYDKEWHISTTGDIQYTNLAHGNYNFMAYGLNNDSVKSNQPATFTFMIKRPFWLTWWFILLEIIVFCIGFFFVFRFWKNRIQKKEHDKALINQKIAEFKMTALRSQMNPHFVFNAISSIQHYILKQDTFKSYNYLAKFSLLIRTILDNSKEEYIALSQEINTLQLYIELEQIRFKQPFQFILDVDADLEMDTYIPTMLIQPYVENSIWHGLMPKKTNCILQVNLKKKDTHIFVSIKDNGVGRNHVVKKSSLHASKGMSITEQRIKELETTNEKKFNVTIIDLTDEKGDAAGTEVQIIIPFDL